MAALRAVKPGESPKPVKKKSVTEAAESGSHRDLLVAMRERIARTVQNPDCPPRDLAALTRRLQDIAKEIEAIDLRAVEEAKESAASPDEDWDAEAL
ncbi:MAG TPA: hypothetical protein VFH56_14875 [Acidimicrobiales bacterium]|nr:hypothetical protein [Acidimicrobiales bacterium]